MEQLQALYSLKLNYSFKNFYHYFLDNQQISIRLISNCQSHVSECAVGKKRPGMHGYMAHSTQGHVAAWHTPPGTHSHAGVAHSARGHLAARNTLPGDAQLHGSLHPGTRGCVAHSAWGCTVVWHTPPYRQRKLNPKDKITRIWWGLSTFTFNISYVIISRYDLFFQKGCV